MTATTGNVRLSTSSTGKSVKVNRPSKLLTREENEQVFQLLGNKRQTQATAVVQLFSTEPPAHSTWVKRHTGVLCFVKDSSRRSYFMQLYCLSRNELVWEHEVYEPFIINRPRQYLLTFEGHDRIVSFNFASEDETSTYLQTVHNLISSRMRKKEERAKRSVKPARPPNPVVTTNNNNNNDVSDGVVLRNKPALPAIPTIDTSMPAKDAKTNKNDKRTKKKLTKADIGMPTGFKHVTHVGWNSESGFKFDGEDDEALKPFLIKAGVSEQQLKDRETKAFIYDFIQSNNVLESIKSEQLYSPPPVELQQKQQQQEEEKQAVPPVPSRNSAKIVPPPPPSIHTKQAVNRTAPPAPPARHQPAPKRPSPQLQQEFITHERVPDAIPKPPTIRLPDPPKRPPPITSTIPPPPPPPPITIQSPISQPSSNKTSPINSGNAGANLPAITDDRSALMESIRKGTKLRKVDQISVGSSGSGDARTELLNEIRHGTTLRPAEERVLSNRLSNDEAAPTDALALALRRALEQRKGAIQSDSDDDSSESFDNDNEWDD
ncbi:actin nucleation-promoting factor WASL [Culicoides brevitarsis]|uniref:actin nucleation-promoting factor WASL n=1 Tax=Culicoides brevitarsis TaxID=469753 RepID=UPI00307B29A7